MLAVVAVQTTVFFVGKQVWAYLMTPQERAACEGTGYADEVVIAGCTEIIEAGAYDEKAIAVA
jgi:hypothetical protein